jgi:hypothetical protein
MNSPSGKEEGQKPNNHGTYYYVQVNLTVVAMKIRYDRINGSIQH